jgi:flagellar basal-body rod modification protein FlgD
MAVSEIGSASDMQMDYMKLLITQLQNQNPLEPLSNNEMASQLAQFSSLQQLESMNSTFAQVLDTANHSYANSLIGKEVSFLGETATGAVDVLRGVVEQVYKENGENFLIVGDYVLGLEDIISVKNYNQI